MKIIRTISIAAFIILLSGCTGELSDTATPRTVTGVIDLTGDRVILSYGMPISAEGTPEHLPESDDMTSCIVVDVNGNFQETFLQLKLEDYTVIVPTEMDPFREEHWVDGGVRRVLYQPKRDLFHRCRLSMIFDSRSKLRSLDFRGSVRIDPYAKTISLYILPERTE